MQSTSKISKSRASSLRADWCPLSERRLLQKLIAHKPAGINREFNMVLIHLFMNNIFDFEEDTNFEDFLTESDFEMLKKRRQEGKINARSPVNYAPAYAIRPTLKQIEEKLNELYDIELIQENELLPEALEKEMPFDLNKFITDPDWMKFYADQDGQS